MKYIFCLKIKFEPDTKHTNPFGKQDTLIRHLQGRISDLQDDNLRLRDHQQSKIYSTIDSKLTTQGVRKFSSSFSLCFLMKNILKYFC